MPIEVRFFPHLMHLSSDGNSQIMYDVNSSSLLELDYTSAVIIEEAIKRQEFSDETYSIAKEYLCETGIECSNFVESVNLIASLRARGLFQNKVESTYSLIKPHSLVLNTSSACQLSCLYCYAAGGNYGLSDIPSNMSYAIGKRAIDFFWELFDKNRERYTISFFGGEPLINWQVVRDLTLYAESIAAKNNKSVVFNITTNAIGINDEIARFMADHSFDIQVSIDGGRDTHDQLRPLRGGGSSSYQETIKGVSVLRKYTQRITLRATVTSLNYDIAILERDFEQVGSFNCGLGFLQAKRDDPLQLTWEQLKEYADSYSEIITSEKYTSISLAREMPKLIASGMHNMWSCGIASSSIIVATNGDIFPCSRLIDDKYKMGSVINNFDVHKAEKIRIKANVNSILGCRSCWARYICGGGCTSHNIDDSAPHYYPNYHFCYTSMRIIESSIEKLLMASKSRTEK